MGFRASSCRLAAAVLVTAAATAAQAQLITVEPRDPSTLEPVRVTITLALFAESDFSFDGIHGNQIRFSADLPDDAPTLPIFTFTTDVGPLPAGVYQAVLGFRGGSSMITQTFRVKAPEPGLIFPEQADGWSTSVTIDWKLPSRQTGQGFGVALTGEAGYFWFFDPGNTEVTVKILDGRAVNGHWWVFLASMTDVEFTATVSRCPPPPLGAPCEAKQYHIPQGVNRNVIDTRSF